MKTIILFLILLLTAKTALAKNDYFEEGEYLFLKDNLYEKDGEIFFKSKIPSGPNKQQSREIYLKRFAFKGANPNIKLHRKLSEVIDKDSWEKIDNTYVIPPFITVFLSRGLRCG